MELLAANIACLVIVGAVDGHYRKCEQRKRNHMIHTHTIDVDMIESMMLGSVTSPYTVPKAGFHLYKLTRKYYAIKDKKNSEALANDPEYNAMVLREAVLRDNLQQESNSFVERKKKTQRKKLAKLEKQIGRDRVERVYEENSFMLATNHYDLDDESGTFREFGTVETLSRNE